MLIARRQQPVFRVTSMLGSQSGHGIRCREVTWQRDSHDGIRMLPLGIVQVIVHLDGTWEHRPPGSSAWSKRPDTFVSGPFTRGYGLRATAGTRVLSLEFSPDVAARYVPIPIGQIAGDVVLPGDLWGPRWDDALDRIRHSAGPGDLARAMDQLLLTCRQNPPDPAIAATLEHVRACGGVTTVERLHRVAQLSPAQFRRRFKAATGLSAKHFLRIRRLITAVSQAQRQPGVSLAHVAHVSGYADQAHLGHDFQSIAGCSPGQFLGQ